jgi:hypothetical protein
MGISEIGVTGIAGGMLGRAVLEVPGIIED